ncbi:MAG: hypothetical protein HYZ85_03385 [Candidatus Omnitrophica bacterium]|nr:hypothetical protein [Candidatus Omnitrophota bacterium]
MCLDAVYRGMQRIYEQFFIFLNYLQKKFLPKLPEIKEPYEYSSILLLNQAEEKEKNWRLDEAATLYRKYLRHYGSRPDRAYVAISLAHILIRQKKTHEAERLLRTLEVGFAGQDEGRIASSLLKRLGVMKKREILIFQLQREFPAYEGTAHGEELEFKLALAYLSTYRLSEAQEHFKKLENSSQEDLRQKSKFYRAWILKLNENLGGGEQLMLNLLEEPEINRELGLGIKAELADIYYQQKNVDKALKTYESLSAEGEEGRLSQIAAQEAWVALAELEQANIYYFDKGNAELGARHLNKLNTFYPQVSFAKNLNRAFKESSESDLKAKAFKALKQRNIHLAYELFRRNVERQPRDGWTHSGLATVFVLMGDLNEAADYAAEGHRLSPDEYTSSVRGYVEGFLLHWDLSVEYYLAALSRAPGYIPARYNLGCAYLKAGKFPEAYELFESLNTEFQKVKNVMRSKILNNMGYSLWHMGQKDEAYGWFRESLEVTPGFADAKRNLSLAGAPRSTAAISMEGP